MQDHSAAFGILGLLFLVFVIVLAVAATAFWIWMLIHAITNKGLSESEKLIWVLVIIFVHIVGALIYFFVGRPKAATGPPRMA